MAVLQADPATGTPLTYLLTFLLAAAFYALTAHIAARWVVGETPLRSAIAVGVVPAIVTLLTLGIRPLATGVVVGLAVLADGAAIHRVYGEEARVTAILTAVHVGVSVALGLAFLNLYGILG